MAHHTRVRADFAAWASGAVTQTEFDKFDAQLFKSLNADEGGVWAPSNVIEIGGAGVRLNGATTDITWPSGEYPKLSTRTFFVQVPHSSGYVSGLTGSTPFWTVRSGGGGNNFVSNLIQSDVSLNGAVWFPIRPPVGSTITEFVVGLKGDLDSLGAHAAKPTNMPTIWLARYSAGTTEIITGKTDDSPDVASYDNVHIINLTGLSQVIETGYQYYLRVTGESGTNSIANRLGIRYLRYTLSVNNIRPVT